MRILEFIIFSVIDLQKEIQSLLIDFRIIHAKDDWNKVAIKLKLVHLNFSSIFDLLYHMHWSQIFVLFVDLNYQISYKIKLLNWNAMELLFREQLNEKILELL